MLGKIKKSLINSDFSLKNMSGDNLIRDRIYSTLSGDEVATTDLNYCSSLFYVLWVVSGPKVATTIVFNYKITVQIVISRYFHD